MVNHNRLQQALDSWPGWGDWLEHKPELIRELSEGETNQSFLLDVRTEKCVLRLDRPDAKMLGINRHQEYLIWQAAARAGVSPGLLYQNQTQGLLIYNYAEGRIWAASDFAHSTQLAKLKSRIDQYQQIAIDIQPRNYTSYLSHYWQQIEARNLDDNSLKQAWMDFLPRLQAFQNSGWQPCLSHHDLIPENIVETKNGIMILDWEYAAMGHPDLDWSWVTGEKDSDVSEVIHWINKLWHLLA